MMIVIILTQTMERSSSLYSFSLEVSRDDIIIIRARARKVVYFVKRKIWIFNSALQKNLLFFHGGLRIDDAQLASGTRPLADRSGNFPPGIS